MHIACRNQHNNGKEAKKTIQFEFIFNSCNKNNQTWYFIPVSFCQVVCVCVCMGWSQGGGMAVKNLGIWPQFSTVPSGPGKHLCIKTMLDPCIT